MLHLLAGRAQHPPAQRNDQAALFSNRDKFGRRHHAQFGMSPAGQCFDAHQCQGAGIDNGLIVDRQLLLFQRLAQVSFQLQTFAHFPMHFIIKDLINCFAIGFGAVEGGISVA